WVLVLEQTQEQAAVTHAADHGKQPRRVESMPPETGGAIVQDTSHPTILAQSASELADALRRGARRDMHGELVERFLGLKSEEHRGNFRRAGPSHHPALKRLGDAYRGGSRPPRLPQAPRAIHEEQQHQQSEE